LLKLDPTTLAGDRDLHLPYFSEPGGYLNFVLVCHLALCDVGQGALGCALAFGLEPYAHAPGGLVTRVVMHYAK
jgi:hypothetical protein